MKASPARMGAAVNSITVHLEIHRCAHTGVVLGVDESVPCDPPKRRRCAQTGVGD